MHSIAQSIPTSFETETAFVLLPPPTVTSNATEEFNPTLRGDLASLEHDQRGIPDSALND